MWDLYTMTLKHLPPVLTSLPRLVDRCVIKTPRLHLVADVLGDGLDEDDRHGGVQLLQLGLGDGPGVYVPPRSLIWG